MLAAHVEYLDYKKDIQRYFILTNNFEEETLLADANNFRLYVTFYLLAESMGFDPTKQTEIEEMTSGNFAVWRTSKQNEVRF